MNHWKRSIIVLSAVAMLSGLSMVEARADSLDGPPQIAGLQFGNSAISVSGVDFATVSVSVRLTDQDGVIGAEVSVDSATGGRTYELIPLTLALGTANDGWWTGTFYVGSLDNGQLRVSNIEAYDTQQNELSADPAASGFDPRMTVTGSDPPSLSAGFSSSLITYGDAVWFKGRLTHKNTGAPWAGIPITVYGGDDPCCPAFKRVRTNSDGYWGAYFGAGGGVPSVALPLAQQLGAVITGPPDAFAKNFRVAENWKWPNVRVRVWATMTQSSIRLGGTTTIWGSVAPSANTAELQRLVSGVWKTVVAARVHSTGRYYLTAHPPIRGYLRYRVYIPTYSMLGNTTKTLILHVY